MLIQLKAIAVTTSVKSLREGRQGIASFMSEAAMRNGN